MPRYRKWYLPHMVKCGLLFAYERAARKGTRMQRHFTTVPPGGGIPVENQLPGSVIEETSPRMAARTICETVRDEHGRKGIAAFLAAAAPFLPCELIAETAQYFHVDTPPEARPESPKPAQKEAPPIPPELLMQLLQQGGGSGGLDPMMLLKMLQK